MAEKVEAKTEDRLAKTIWYTRIPFLILFAAALIWGGLLIYRWYSGTEDQKSLIELHKLALRADAEADEAKALEAVNGDYYAWLTVYGTTVDHPIVQGEDDEYYLSHDFYGRSDSSGCLFLDSRVDTDADGNMLIIGHNMKNRTMFGGLVDYTDVEFFGEHGAVGLEKDGKETFYEIFAMLVVPGDPDDDRYFELGEYLNDISEAKTAELLSALRAQALLWRDIEPENDDRFLFLETSDYSDTEGCLLLCARRLG